MNAHFSPDGKKIGFVFENNLYYKNLEDGSIVQITSDGEKNAIINGAADWVYEEEFAITRTFEWSSDSRYLDRKSTRLNSSHVAISYAVFCLKKKKKCTDQKSTLRNHRPIAQYTADIAFQH